MKKLIKKTPVLNSIFRKVYNVFNRKINFKDSNTYWINRYSNGGNSGDGSYNKLAEFKAEIINDFVDKEDIISVIEFGCGDGNQLKHAKYPKYTGFDISIEIINSCSSLFQNDKSKLFKHVDSYRNESSELTLSLDVIYHLIEDDVFEKYMDLLFKSSNKYVIIYSSNTDINPENTANHVKHRRFSNWIDSNLSEWSLLKHIPNKYPGNGNNSQSSFADFYFYKKTSL